jgi:hypothetical protein
MKFIEVTAMVPKRNEETRSLDWVISGTHYINVESIIRINERSDGRTDILLPSSNYVYAKESVTEILERIHE